MKHNFKFQQYSALAAILLSAKITSSQIIYTDPDPDLHMIGDPGLGGFYFEEDTLDLNNDGINDFRIGMHYVSTISQDAYITAFGLNKVGYEIQYGTTCPFSIERSFEITPLMEEGAVIGDDENFLNGRASFFYQDFGDTSCAGTRVGEKTVDMQFAPLILHFDGADHYAWIRYSIVFNSSTDVRTFIVHDYAYEATAGATIISGETDGCFPPLPLAASPVTPTAAKIKWQAVGSALSYKLQYRVAGTSAWSKKNVPAPNTAKTITGLLCSTEYEWRVRAICEGGTATAFCPVQTFSTAGCKLSESEDAEVISIYPNPVHDLLQISFDGESPVTTVEIFDITGNKMMEMQMSAEEMPALNVSDLPAGMYYIVLYTKTDIVTRQFTVMK